jgi:hypothetical protein
MIFRCVICVFFFASISNWLVTMYQCKSLSVVHHHFYNPILSRCQRPKFKQNLYRPQILQEQGNASCIWIIHITPALDKSTWLRTSSLTMPPTLRSEGSNSKNVCHYHVNTFYFFGEGLYRLLACCLILLCFIHNEIMYVKLTVTLFYYNITQTRMILE